MFFPYKKDLMKVFAILFKIPSEHCVFLLKVFVFIRNKRKMYKNQQIMDIFFVVMS